MIKILIVEDEGEKLRVVSDLLLKSPGIGYENITICSDVHSAKVKIKDQKFDLMILDINLPKRPDKAPEINAGIDVLDFIKRDSRAIAPNYIIGLSAYSESALAASHEFTSALWKMIYFSHTDNGWEEPLTQAVSFLVARDAPPYSTDGNTYHVDIGIITALPEELEQVRLLPIEWSPITVRHDMSSYIQGTLDVEGSKLSLVAVCAPKMGMPAAGVTAAALINTFRPRFLAMLGICAGVRGKADIGDILMADPCFDWGSGKWVKIDEKLRFRPAPYPWRLDASLAAGALRAGTQDVMNSIYQEYKSSRPANTPKLLIDAMASGGSVLQSQALVDDVKDQHKNLIGIEMESYAVFTAAEYSSSPRPKCFSIKSVCDFGDEHKGDSYHTYAAYTSAAFFYNLCKLELIKMTGRL